MWSSLFVKSFFSVRVAAIRSPRLKGKKGTTGGQPDVNGRPDDLLVFTGDLKSRTRPQMTPRRPTPFLLKDLNSFLKVQLTTTAFADLVKMRSSPI